ncbi:MAG: UbiA family prenyltransferase [Planctomycetota bacterium]
MPTLLTLGRLVRVSLAATAIGDALVGLAIAYVGAWPAPKAFLLVFASLGVYHGAMALNDWADREADAREGRPRPLPRGEITPRAAFAVALTCMLGGVALAAAIAPAVGTWMAGVAALAAAYDLFGRGPYLGPLLLGACRGGNLAAGTIVAHALGAAPVAADAGVLWIALLYGTYIFGVSSLGRLEDGEDQLPLGLRPQRALSRIMVGFQMAVAGTFIAWPEGLARSTPFLVGIGISFLGALWFAARVVVPMYAHRNWTRRDAGSATGVYLRALLLLQAAIALPFAAVGPLGAVAFAACLLGYPLAKALRHLFPPT